MATSTTTNETDKKLPVAEATRRRNFQGALWQHEDRNGNPRHVVGLTRSEKGKDDKWKNETIYVHLDDIPKAIAILQELETRAYKIIEEDYQASKNAA